MPQIEPEKLSKEKKSKNPYETESELSRSEQRANKMEEEGVGEAEGKEKGEAEGKDEMNVDDPPYQNHKLVKITLLADGGG